MGLDVTIQDFLYRILSDSTGIRTRMLRRESYRLLEGAK